ncbi:MAG: cupin domain-containing protein, partial [Anaerolineales bacterium]
MHIRQAQDITPLHTGHGEVVRELGGHSAGGLQKHSMAEITLPPGVASLKHYHPEVEESYYILEGQPRIEIDDRAIQLSPGQLVA